MAPTAELKGGRAAPVVVVLAAGRGSRFEGNGHKLAQLLGGTSVLARTLEVVMTAGLPLVVVTTAPLAPLVLDMVASRDVVLLPPVDSRSAEPLGMGYSIAAGVTARPNAPGWLVLPGDMPLVRPDSLLAVARALRERTIVYAQHQGRRGHPVGFAGELYTELALLQGDDGARRLLARYPADAVELDDPGVLLDVDTEADLRRARAMGADGQPVSAVS